MSKKVTSIYEIADLNSKSITKDDTPNSIYYLDTSNITRNRIDNLKYLQLSKEEYPSRAKRKVKDKTIVYSTVRPNQEHFGILDNPIENLIVSTGFTTIDIKDINVIDPLYLYYYITQKRITNHLQAIAENSVSSYPSINSSDIGELIITFPLEIKEQQKKITLLSSIDKKIELNNRINAELETMVKYLYDYWFVQFDFPNEEGKPYKSSGGKMVYNNILKREIPEGWEIGTISEFIASSKGGDWGKETIEGKYTMPVICVRGADINGLNGSGQIGAPKRYILDKNKEKFLLPYDLVIEISGGSPTQSTGRLLLITDEMLSRFDEPLICSNFCKAISLVNHQYAYNFKYMWDSIYDSGVLFGWEGKTSGIKNLLFESFVSKYIICMPAVELVNKFFSLAEDIHKKKQNNLKENEKIIQLRDFLLPMLMNGQVTVK